MSLLKRRSRSESRKIEITENVALKTTAKETEMEAMTTSSSLSSSSSTMPRNGRTRNSRQQMQRAPLERMETVPGMGRRKTSAELISEAKIFLGSMSSSNSSLAAPTQAASSVGGVRLLNTRRPITPRESGRALYGKVALAGRPPSAFSLRYLQNENLRAPKTPSLEPIKGQNSLDLDTATEERLKMRSKEKRSNSLDAQSLFLKIGNEHSNIQNQSRIDGEKSNKIHNVNEERKMAINTDFRQTKMFPKKLPALEIKGIALGGNMDTKPLNTDLNQYNKDLKEQDKTMIGLNGANMPIGLLTSRRLLTRNYDVLAQSSTEKLIQLLKEHTGLKDCGDETVQHIISILNELYGRVRRNEKNFKRGFILGGLYGLVECTSPKILLAIARVVLALRVTGSNLTGACKLIFKVARNEQNDQLFYDNDLLELLIDGLGRASPLDDPEACIYGYGSIRFLTSANGQERNENEDDINSNNKNNNFQNGNNKNVDCMKLPQKPATAPAGGGGVGDIYKRYPLNFEIMQYENFQKLNKQCTLVERLARHGALELMVLHLQILNEAGAAQKLSGPPLHSLYQLSATLRALADVCQISNSLERELENDDDNNDMIGNDFMGKSTNASAIELELACPHLVRAAEISIGELEVQANIVRTLSILSENENCCKTLASFTARIGMMLGPCLELFNCASEKLLTLFSRLGYILGNIMAKFDESRVQFYHNDVAMENLLKVMQLYAKESLTQQNAMGDTVIDVLIKMIRVVANMSVNSEVGFGLGNTHTLGALLLNLLTTTNQHVQVEVEKAQNDIQELTLATLGALHNLCFYQDKNSTPAQVLESKDSLQSVLLDVTTALCIKLRTSNDAIIEVESARVLGNITRNDKARKYFCKVGGLPLILEILQRTNNNNVDNNFDYDLKACGIGVLVNLLGDAENRAPFLKLNGVSILSKLLHWILDKRYDWFLATITCQAFWNLLIDAPCMSDICDERLLDDFCDLLSDYLDERYMFETHNNGQPDELWEGFAMVATDLLERIQNNFEQQNQQEEVDMVSYANDDEDDVYIEEM